MAEKIMKIAENWLSQNLTPNNQTQKPFGINTPDSYKSVNFKTQLSPVFSRPQQQQVQQQQTQQPVQEQIPELYQTKSFDREAKLREMYGTNASKRDIRRFNKYWNSDQRWADQEAFEAAEHQKYMDSMDARFNAVHKDVKTKSAATIQGITDSLNRQPIQQKPINKGRSTDEVRAIQNEMLSKGYDLGRYGADGIWGKDTQLAYDMYIQNGKRSWKDVYGDEVPPIASVNKYYTDNAKNRYSYINGKLTKLTDADNTEGWQNAGLIKDMEEFKNAVKFDQQNVDFGGMTWANPYYLNNVFRETKNAPDWNQSGQGQGAVVKVKGKNGVYPLRVWNDRSFAIDTENNVAYELNEDMFGEVDGRGNDAPIKTYDLWSFFNKFTPEEQQQLRKQKQGGQINKHQQGGTMGNQEELQKAFMAFLIEDAAAQGMQIQSEQDLQAYAQQLGEEGLKAKYQEFMQKMQGGVKAALGAKLNYIHKLKGNCPEGEELVYMKQGGRMCPVCQKKAEKAEEGKKLQKKNAVSDFKEKRKKINPNDTVNTKFGPRDLNGKTKYPKYDATKENYDYETRKRVQEKDEKSGKKVLGSACGSKIKKK